MFDSNQRARRGIPIAIAAIAVPLVLAGCVPTQPVDDGAVGFDDIQSATIQLEAEGTFVFPGTTEAVSSGGYGSGFLIDDTGLAVTNNHVAGGAGTLKAWVGGDTSVTLGAEILGASECLDIAVVRVKAEDLPHFGWYQGKIKAALDVYSAGFPLGDPNFTLTRGIVSKPDVPQETPWSSLDHVIEHDARIRGGNSGGPLVAANGRVVGINYAGNDTLDYNFAIHRDQVIPVIEDLAAGKTVLSLGINPTALTPDESGTANGIWVNSVQAGSAAAKAGILPGDVLTELGGVVLARQGTMQEYCEVVSTQGSDATIAVSVYRPSENAFYGGEVNGEKIVRTSAEPAPPVDPVSSFVMVQDAEGTVSVSVPSTWADVVYGPIEQGGVVFANVSASPNIADFNGTWSTPGVSLSATTDTSRSIDDYLAGFESSLAPECEASEPGEYDDGLYVGRYLYLSGCGGTTTDFLALVAMDTAKSHLVLLTVQMVSDDDKEPVLKEILNTFIAKY